jgi:antitoxin component YwqK of YwqJK toxin-antitoxin module
MKKLNFIYVLFVGLFLLSCSEEIEEKKSLENEVLVEVVDGIFTEYYPGRKFVKFQGAQDENNQRHGKWIFKSEKGIEISVTHYNHGIRNGHTIVKHANGSIFYYGEFSQDKKVGVWKTYDEKGKLIDEKDFGKVD